MRFNTSCFRQISPVLAGQVARHDTDVRGEPQVLRAVCKASLKLHQFQIPVLYAAERSPTLRKTLRLQQVGGRLYNHPELVLDILISHIQKTSFRDERDNCVTSREHAKLLPLNAESRFTLLMSRYDLTGFEWRVIKPLLPNKPRGVPRVDDRRVLNGIFWVLRSGAPWRDLPERYGPRTTCYNRFVRWRKAGVWDRLMGAITAAHEGDIQMIDSTSVRAHQQAATAKRDRDHCLGRSRGGLTTKIHVVVDAQGLPIRLGLTAGQAHDGQIADTLLDRLGPRTIVLADRAYDADRIRELIQNQGATPNIPPKSNRKWKPCFSKRLYRERNLVERFFSKLKHFRRVATRYDKLAANFLAMVQLASMRLWLRAYESTT
jgi:transposase